MFKYLSSIDINTTKTIFREYSYSKMQSKAFGSQGYQPNRSVYSIVFYSTSLLQQFFILNKPHRMGAQSAFVNPNLSWFSHNARVSTFIKGTRYKTGTSALTDKSIRQIFCLILTGGCIADRRRCIVFETCTQGVLKEILRPQVTFREHFLHQMHVFASCKLNTAKLG